MLGDLRSRTGRPQGTPLHQARAARFLPAQERRGQGRPQGTPLHQTRAARFLPAQERRGKGAHKGRPYTRQGLRGSCLRRNDGGRAPTRDAPTPGKGCEVPACAGTTGEGRPQGTPLHHARAARFLPPQERRGTGRPQGDAPTPGKGCKVPASAGTTGNRAPTRDAPTRQGLRGACLRRNDGEGRSQGTPLHQARAARCLPPQERRGKGAHKGRPYTMQGLRGSCLRRNDGGKAPTRDAPTPGTAPAPHRGGIGWTVGLGAL